MFSELGVVFLPFAVGLQSCSSEMRAVSGPRAPGGLPSDVVRWVVGLAFGEALGDGLETSLISGPR